MKKILCLLLAAFASFALFSCDQDTTDGTIGQENETSAPAPSLTVNGIDISEFHVVYKTSNEHLQFKTYAVDFVDFVKRNYGVELDYGSDLLPENDREIIFGDTSRRSACEEFSADYDCGEYKVSVKGENVVISADYVSGCAKGYEVFLEMITEKDGSLTDVESSGAAEIIKVACVGDSITHGINSDDAVNMTYPAYLQDMLGSDYYVLNAGMSGYSIVRTDEYAYCKTSQFAEAKAFAPDVVIFNLGTNDANPTPTQPYKNWDDPKNNREELFIESTRELLDSFKTSNPDCQIYICLPSAVFKVGGDSWNAEAWTENLIDHSLPLLENIAKDYGYQTIDLYSWSLENKSVFTDGLHPRNETYKTYAEYVYQSIKETVKKPESSRRK